MFFVALKNMNTHTHVSENTCVSKEAQTYAFNLDIQNLHRPS